ncbi:MAG: hypothetical protein JSW11_02340 [Candidatus Heimdallarchaeota archaeon]|nr:MAG: hypothetical protein JSW11_02340 [Candidatus Heimdallarchaeota archaeon]
MQHKLFILFLIIFFYPSVIPCISQNNDQGPTSLRWHENLKIDTILGWKITELTLLDVPHFKIGEMKIYPYDVVQIGLVRDPPVEAKDFFGLEYLIYNYNPPIWINFFVESIRIDLELAQVDLEIGKKTEFTFLQLFALPIEYVFENGSSSSLDYFLDVFGTVIFDLQDYSVTQDNRSFIVEWNTGIDTNKTSYSYTISRTTGVTTRFSWNTSEFRMVWDYFFEATNLNLDGELKNLDDRYSVQLIYPVTTPWELVIFAFLIIVPLALLVIIKTIKRFEKKFPYEDLVDSEIE